MYLYILIISRDMQKMTNSCIILYFVYLDEKSGKMAEVLSFESKGMDNMENRREEKSYEVHYIFYLHG